MRELEDQFPEPRSRADERRLESAHRRPTSALGIARRSARWLAPADEP